MFGQFKAITSISNQHTSQIIMNILVHLQSEEDAHAGELSSVQKQNSQVTMSAKALPTNTVTQLKWIHNSAVHYQAHLETIGDYLCEGPGIWNL